MSGELGARERAYEILMCSYEPNEMPPFGVIAGTAGGTNLYLQTGAGGMLQPVIFGFGGLSMTDNGITQNKEPTS